MTRIYCKQELFKKSLVIHVHTSAKGLFSSVLQVNGGSVDSIAATYCPETRRSLNFPEMTEAVLKKMLEFSYTLQVTRLDRTPFELLLAAHRYRFSGLQALAEREIAKHVDINSVLDLYVWNELLNSDFLGAIIGMFFCTQFSQIRLLPEYQSKLTEDQRATIEHLYANGLSQTGEAAVDGEMSDNNPDDFEDSGVDSYEDDDDENFGYQDDETDDGMTDDISDGDRMPALGELGEEPEEPQAVAAPNQVALDQAAMLANMLGAGFGELDADAMDFILMLM